MSFKYNTSCTFLKQERVLEGPSEYTLYTCRINQFTEDCCDYCKYNEKDYSKGTTQKDMINYFKSNDML